MLVLGKKTIGFIWRGVLDAQYASGVIIQVQIRPPKGVQIREGNRDIPVFEMPTLG